MDKELYASSHQMVLFVNAPPVKMGSHFPGAFALSTNVQSRDHVNHHKFVFRDVVNTNVKVLFAAWARFVALQRANAFAKIITLAIRI